MSGNNHQRPSSWRDPGNRPSNSAGEDQAKEGAPPLSLSFYNNANNPLTLLSSTNPGTTTTPKGTKNGYGEYATKNASSKNALRPVAVRERSKAIPHCKEIKPRKSDPFSTTISFLITPSDDDTTTYGKENKAPPSSQKIPMRVNVFCDTGTVGTSRVVDGKVRQSFRRNVTSLDVLERLLRHPEGPVAIEPSLIGFTDDTQTVSTVIPISMKTKEDFQKEAEFVDVGLCILDGEREKLQKHLQSLKEEEEKQTKQKKMKPSISEKETHLESTVSSGELQAQMIEKTLSKKEDNTKTRIGRRRNKLSNLRNRNLQNGKPKNEDTNAAAMNNTKRRGGKLATTKNTTDAKTTAVQKKRNNSIAKPFKNCGYEFHFKLPAEVMSQVDQCLRDIAKMNKIVKGVSTNGRGTVFLYGNGGVAYTPAIPKALYHKLRQLRSSSYASRPCMVALGTRDRFFVSFNDGSADWKGSSTLDKVLKKKVLRKHGSQSVGSGGNHSESGPNDTSVDGNLATLPRSVAFGATYDTFFIVFHDGSWQYQGRSIPRSLEDKLAERDDRDDLVVCNLGPSGEWFLKAENGKMWWSGISSELDAVLTQIKSKGGFIHNMDFGENGSYFVSYDEE